MKPSVAIVDGDENFASRTADIAMRKGFAATSLDSVHGAWRWLRRNEPDLLLVDVEAPGGGAIELLSMVGDESRAKVVLLSAAGTPSHDLPTVVTDLIEKPIPDQRLDHLFDDVLAAVRLRDDGHDGRFGIVGDCARVRRIHRDIARIAPLDVSVLITGETGTGKELVARALHAASGRRGRLVAVNCGAIPPDLLASQLFGHERGSFTGANQRHAGFFEQAQGGTLFLDEIGEMPPELQVYLLRCLETRSVTRVGSASEVDLDVRIVAATHRDLASPGSSLRRDLYYRLSQYPIDLPPLRERGADIHLIADMLLARLNARYGTFKQMDSFSRQVIETHGWPGNVRELSSAITRAYYRADGELITVEPLMPDKPRREDPGVVSFRVGTSLRQVEEEMLRRTLAANGGDKTATARSLGVSVRTIHNHLARRPRS